MNWKDNIEAQIAWLAMEPEPRTQDCAQVMRDLLDVATAADDVAQYCDIDDAGWMDSLIAAIDKLKKVSDE